MNLLLAFRNGIGILEVDHQQAPRHGDLHRGKADADRFVHRVEHVADEPLEVAVDALDRRGRGPQHRIGN